jgi:hypothetical protein
VNIVVQRSVARRQPTLASSNTRSRHLCHDLSLSHTHARAHALGAMVAATLLCVLVFRKVAAMRTRGLDDVVHLVSIGGWNSPHPDTRFTAEQWWAEWARWNKDEVARPAMGWEGFAGFDWDIEGNDDGAHHGNVFSLASLDLMGAMSVLAKRDGLIVAMAPAQSYLDPGALRSPLCVCVCVCVCVCGGGVVE